MMGYKTIVVGILTILAGALGAVPEDWDTGTIAQINGVIMIIMRVLTSTPIMSGKD